MKKTLVAVVAGGSLLVSGTPALAQQAAKPTLGPYGYGAVKLGMSTKKAKATGRIVQKLKAGASACSGWDFKAHPTGKHAVGLFISKNVGVAVIFAAKGVKTPRGIGLGSTLKQAKKAYPGIKTSASGIPYVRVPGNSKAYYAFLTDRKGKINELAFGLHKQDCVN